jgi:acetolactate synthase I/II/III large subunit
MPKGADVLVAALENEGVDRIFGVPGEENLDVVESLRKSKIKLILTRHEQAAAFMAATHGRLTGRPGVCISTLGPGALNLSTGAAYAHLGAISTKCPRFWIENTIPVSTRSFRAAFTGARETLNRSANSCAGK